MNLIKNGRLNKKLVFVVLFIVLFSTMRLVSISTKVFAEQEMTPEWIYENRGLFFRTVISANGSYVGAGTSDTNRFYLFRDSLSLWNHSVGSVHSISMSSDGRYVAVGAESDLYLFDSEVTTPLLTYSIGYEISQVVISADGKHVAVGAGPREYYENAESKLYMFERGKSIPTWNKTLQGVLESLSMSSDGSYIVASTSLPGVVYVFARELETQLWNNTFGDWTGGAKISSDGNYIVAVGGDKGNRRVFRFIRQNESARYQKLISELPSHQGLSVSSNGSIFAISYTGSNRLILFNLELPPYGYGPGSVLNVSLPGRRVSMSMSSDGRCIFVGTSEGIFVYEYVNSRLSLKKQYTHNSPIIYDVASSSDGRYLVAVGRWGSSGDEHSNVYFFDVFRETAGSLNPLVEWSLPMLIAMVVTAGTVVFVLYKRERKKR